MSEQPLFELAQVNVGRLAAPLDSPQLADFVANLEPVNAGADAAPGFRWRLATVDGDATAISAFEWDAAGSVGVIVNLSVWRDVESLTAYVYDDLHRAVLKRRREWFLPMREAYVACWWVPAGHRPSVDEAEDKVRELRANGPSPAVFPLRQPFGPPTSDGV